MVTGDPRLSTDNAIIRSAVVAIEFDRTHEITLTFTISQFDPTLPPFQGSFLRRSFSKECDNVGKATYVRVVSAFV